MWVIVITVLYALTTTVQGNGFSDDTDWAFIWYLDEPFHFLCDKSIYKLDMNGSYYIAWDTPTDKNITVGYDSSDYRVLGPELDGSELVTKVDGSELVVKKVEERVHGVYKCKLYNTTMPDKMVGQAVFGLNIHEIKYRTLFDKYRRNLIVAVISTAVFLFVLGLPCIVYRFQYLSDEDRRERAEQKRAYMQFMSDGPANEMKQSIPDDDIAYNGKRAYDNPGMDLSTQL